MNETQQPDVTSATEAGGTYERVYEDGELIFAEGQIGEVAYSVIDGEVVVFKRGKDGEEILLGELSEGALFGEMALVENAPRSASAKARGRTSLRVLDRRMLIERMSDNPDMGLALMHRLAGYVRVANERLAAGSFSNEPEELLPDQSTFLDRVLPWRNRLDTQVARFQPDVVAIENQPVPAAARLGAYAILSFFVAAGIWASLAVVDTSISARGVISPSSGTISLQAPEAGAISRFEVTAGEQVAAGEILLTLEDTDVQAQIAALRANRQSTAARLKRLEAERSAQMALPPPVRFSDDPTDQRIQSDIYQSRATEYQARLNSFERRIGSASAQIEATRSDQVMAAKQRGSILELEEAYKQLFDKKVVSRIQFLSTVNNRIALDREIAGLESRAKAMEAQMRTTQAERDAFVGEWFAQIVEQLSQARLELKGLDEQLVALGRQRADLEIRAPRDSIVQDTYSLSTGSIVQAAQQVAKLVPIDDEMLVRMDVDARDISRLRIGADVSLKLDALPFQKHGEMWGVLEFVSEDTFAETLDGQSASVYRARVRITDDQLQAAPDNFRLLPGMALTGDIRVGERRVITYILYPVARWLGESLREP